MPSVNVTNVIAHPSLSGVTVFPMNGEKASVGVNQRVLVVVEPNVEIPLHSHSVNAHMFVVSGSAKVLSEDATNGELVKTGAIVFFESDSMHGFKAGNEGLKFISTNEGIVDAEAQNWDIKFN